ncbi:C40 family peptidase, partial [Cumulibacter manganitolerans]|uniref:C40 family peptidase n=1 Tax=Cumulibacter manganitolerans TaxID=1884992 RepID=UPI0018861A7A
SSAAAPQQPAARSAGTGGSGTAQGAVQAALSKLGSPYVWGAAGPNSFDCSGLTMWAYGQVGVSLPHSSSAQAAAGTTVPLSSLAPGDIVWMPGHVGMYIGNGQVVHAPTTGDVVKVVALSSMGWQKGIRVA